MRRGELVPALEATLRALWGAPFQVGFFRADSAGRSCFSGRAVRLPHAEGHDAKALHLAQALHASLHAELSALPFEPGQLRPVQRALLGVLEDARVERLALARYPGIRELWAPYFTASVVDGESVSALLGRLARALFDSRYLDPSSWIQRARAAFLAVESTGGSYRELASALGNELGQLRLPFDPAAATTEPRYRDDHSGLWAPEPSSARESSDATQDAVRERASGDSAARKDEPGSELPVTRRHPEWDYLIQRERADYCAIRERARTPTTPVTLSPGALARVRSALRKAHRLHRTRPRAAEGVELDLSAVVTDAALRARGAGGDGRLYRGTEVRPLRVSTLLLLDLSASLTEHELEALQRLVVCVSRGMPRGAELAVDGFCSRGRHDVLYERYQEFGAPALTLGPERPRTGSTRLGAALRHATERLCARRAARRVLLVVTDGEAADVDVFDDRYLPEDAKRACEDARARGVRVVSWCLRERVTAVQGRVFSKVGAAVLRRGRLEELPRSLIRAYAPGRSGPGVHS